MGAATRARAAASTPLAAGLGPFWREADGSPGMTSSVAHNFPLQRTGVAVLTPAAKRAR